MRTKRTNFSKKQSIEIKTKNDVPPVMNAKKLLCRYRMDGCGHCIDSQKDWDNVCKKVEGKLNPDCMLAEVEEKMLPFFRMADGFKPQGFPTHSIFENGKHVENVEDRTFQGLMKNLRKHNFIKNKNNNKNKNRFTTGKRRRSFRQQ